MERPTRDMIVVGASAGGVEALMTLVAGLPAKLPAIVCVVLHTSPSAPSVLASILSRSGALPAATAHDGEPLRKGHIYVAPPDHHVLLTPEGIRLSRGPHENRHRPAVDVLFRTAARAFGPRVVGVVLTGALNDGTAGLLAIKRMGGVAIAQDPATALFPSMPASACRYVDLDYRLPLAEIPPILTQLARAPVSVEGVPPVPKDLEEETDIAGLNPAIMDHDSVPGALTSLTCPECKGPLWEIKDGELLRYRCRVGHAFTVDAMEEGLSEAIEEALWVALNTLEENAQMLTRMAHDARQHNHTALATRLEARIAHKQRNVATLRHVLFTLPEPETDQVVVDVAKSADTD